MIHGTPEIVLLAVDLHKDLVEMSPPIAESPHRLDPASADLGREDRPAPVPLEPHCLMRNVDAPLMELILDIPQRERIADVHHHRRADDLGGRLEVSKYAGVRHATDLPALPLSRQPDFPLTESVEMPLPMAESPHRLNAAPSDLGRENCP